MIVQDPTRNAFVSFETSTLLPGNVPGTRYQYQLFNHKALIIMRKKPLLIFSYGREQGFPSTY